MASKVMTVDGLQQFIDRRLRRALNREDGTISQHRRELFNRYQGLPYGPNGPGAEREGYSQFRTREVMEGVEWALPAILEVFMASDRIVEFEATNETDEDKARQETDIVNYMVLRANDGDGFLELANFVKDALMIPTAYFKTYVEETEKAEIKEVAEVTTMVMQDILQNADIEILEQTPYMVERPTPPELVQVGAPPSQEVEVYKLKLKEMKKRPKLQLRGVPGEEMLIGSTLTSTNMDEADFIAHRQSRSRSDLIAEGFTDAQLDEVRSHEHCTWHGERINRMFYEDEQSVESFIDGEDSKADANFIVHECYLNVDFDGDGVAEMRRVLMVGDTIFENEEVNYQPFVAMSSLLNPHKHVGLSVAELVLDIQMLLTTLVRQLLDSVYQQNVGKFAIDERALLPDGSSIDAILNTQSRFFKVRGSPRDAIAPVVAPSVLRELLPAIQDARSMLPMRTGIAPENDINPEVLQGAKTGAFMGAMKKANERLALIIRIMAETGFKPICRKTHQLLRMHPSLVESVKLRGQWVPVKADEWDERTDMTVNVGLGYNSDDQTKQSLLALFEIMTTHLIGMGLAGPEHVYAIMDKFVRMSGIGSTSQYLKNPESPGWQPPQPQPDPAMISAEAQAKAVEKDYEVRMTDVQQKAQVESSRLELDSQRIQIEAERAGAEIEKTAIEGRQKESDAVLRTMHQSNEDAEAKAKTKNLDADTQLKLAMVQSTLSEANKKDKEAEHVGKEPAKKDQNAE